MISEFMKQQRAEKAERSQFKPGAFVAIVNHHWDRRVERTATVMKVHANGNFTICNRDGTANPQQWIPDWEGNAARMAGKPSGFRHPEHLEIWTSGHADEIVAQRFAYERAARLAAISARLTERGRTLSHHSLCALEAALGLSIATPNAPEAD